MVKHRVIRRLLTILIIHLFAVNLVSSEPGTINLPGSSKHYTEKRINDFFNVPDWYPDSHPKMPEVVQFGARPKVFACASCHLTSGIGHPESSSLAGLPPEYFFRQMKAYQNFERNSIIGVMITLAKNMTDEQIRESAEYFAALTPRNVQEVIEVDTVPQTYVNARFMRLIKKDGSQQEEPIGERIITIPKDESRVLARDPFATFITYVPKGYLELGKRIVTKGNRGAAACTSCHGADLKGSPVGTLLAGQHASYLAAQLRAYKDGTRRGQADPGGIMANNVKLFTEKEILAAAAYLASLRWE